MTSTLYAAFFFSGLAGLIYEVTWTRFLGLAFGSTVAATSVAIAAFFAGMGLGSRILGPRADRVRSPLRMFAWLEAATAAAASVTLLVFAALPDIYRTVYHLLGLSTTIPLLLVFALSFLLMFIPAFCLGGTFPAVARTLLDDPRRPSATIGRLYGYNTLGAVIGAGSCAFLLVGTIGMTWTIVIAAVINLLLAAVTYHYSTRTDLVPLPTSSVKNRGTTPGTFLSAALLTGFAGIGLEMFWIRILSSYLANTTYTFSIILMVFLGGSAAGSFVYARWMKDVSPAKVLAYSQAGIVIWVCATTLLAGKLPDLLFASRGAIAIPVLRIFLPALLLAAALVFVPTLLMGAGFPALCTLAVRSRPDVAARIGAISCANMLGSVSGSLAAGFVLIPALGVARGTVITLLASAVVAISMLGHDRRPRHALAGGITMLFVLGITYASSARSMILPPSISRTPTRSDRVLLYRETRDGTVVVTEDQNTGIRACYVNNSAVIGTTYDALKVVKMLGHLPFAFQPRARTALVIGFGVGVTTATICRHDVERVDCVEICPGVRDAARFFVTFNDHVYANPKVRFVGNDGRTFLLLSRNRYDVISCDPTHPILGSNNLYTREYFALCHDHLSDDGVFCQYLPLHKLSPYEFRTLIRTFSSVFPCATIWLGHAHAVMVGMKWPLPLDFAELRRGLAALNDPVLSDPYVLAAALMLTPDGVSRAGAGGAMNTDDHPVVEFFKPASLDQANWERNLDVLRAAMIDPAQVFTDAPQDTLRRYVQGRYYLLEALVCQNRGDRVGMRERLSQALARNPENREIQRLLE